MGWWESSQAAKATHLFKWRERQSRSRGEGVEKAQTGGRRPTGVGQPRKVARDLMAASNPPPGSARLSGSVRVCLCLSLSVVSVVSAAVAPSGK